MAEKWRELDVQVYKPFPDGDAPEEWPTDFVAAEDAVSLAVDRDQWKALAETLQAAAPATHPNPVERAQTLDEATHYAIQLDAAMWRELMAPKEGLRTGAEALRRTARGACEDWLEARNG